MKKIIKLLKKVYQNVLYSIAFYPVLISLLFLLFAIAGIAIEDVSFMKELKQNIPFFFIEDIDTVRTILSTVIGGILSLTVFSFTMVMVVLNQASSNFSPRLLPGLVSNKRHQIILGVYIGTLLYAIIVLIAQGAYGIDSVSMGATTMFAAMFGVLCVALFVSFIHSISRSIQIENIINGIFNECWNDLSDKIEREEESEYSEDIDTSNWNVIEIDRTGYYLGFDKALFSEKMNNQELDIEFLPYNGQHLWKGMPVARVKQEISEEIIENLLFTISTSSDRLGRRAFMPGIAKLMEIAVKAMSPGINDPGTAVDVMTKIGRLLRKSLELPERSIRKEGDICTIITSNVSLEVIMNLIVQPIRWYARSDRMVLLEIAEAINYTKDSPKATNEHQKLLNNELEAIRFCVDNYLEIPMDKNLILDVLK